MASNTENTEQVTETNTETTQMSNEERFIGNVKWFDNKMGYGFLTYKKDDKDHDVFVHHTSIKPQTEGYRTLNQGEWVEFSLSDSRNKDTKQASNVTGPKNGPLLCDIRRRNRVVRNTNAKHDRNNKGEWKTVDKKRKSDDN